MCPRDHFYRPTAASEKRADDDLVMFVKTHQLFIKGDKNATDLSRRPMRSVSIYFEQRDPDESQTGPIGINVAKHGVCLWC